MASARENKAPQRPKAKKKSRPNIKIPDDFDTESDFIRWARKLYQDDRDFDQENREAGIEDLEFLAGKQWEESVQSRRIAKRRPALTINRTVAFVGQVVGNRRLNDTAIRFIPNVDGTREVAETRQGLTRNIEKQSKADRAYDTSLLYSAACGLGVFGVELDYACADVFEQEIFIKEVQDPYSVTFDRLGIDRTGRDCGHCFVEETMSKDDFNDAYPWARPSDMSQDYSDAKTDGWFINDDVRVTDFWRMRYRDRVLGLTTTGATIDITDRDLSDPASFADLATHPITGQPIYREAPVPYAEMYKMSGTALLDGPYALPISRIPYFRVPGWELCIQKKRHRWGLIRFLKDPQRLHNYWRSVIAEKLMLTPRAKWTASDQAIAGREKQWRNAHLSDDSVLVWNGESGSPPAYTPPAQLEAALVNEAQITIQDIRDVSNIHEASLGQTSNEVSGRAIAARQRVGELGTVIYHDNLGSAQEECGEVINELIPYVYDTMRIIRTLRLDGKEQMVLINDPYSDQSIDITQGRYSVSITTGPSYATRRVEALESMQTVINAAPNTFGVIGDIMVDLMDWPGADKVAKRLRKTVPANLIDPEELSEDEKEERARMQQQQVQQAEQQQQIQALTVQVELASKQAEIAKANAEAEQAEAKAIRERAEAEKALAEALLARAQAVKALADAEQISRTGSPEAEVASISAQIDDNPATVEVGEISV